MTTINVRDASNNIVSVARIPDTGQATSNNSLPVVLASDQSPLTTQNFNRKFRESFETYTPNATSGVWAEDVATGDIIGIDGNAGGASYLVISKSPLTTNNTSYVVTTNAYSMPCEISVFAHLSQRVVGREFSVELCTDQSSTPPDDVAISSIQQTTTTLTVTTSTDHGYKVGQRIGIHSCNDSRFNYPALVVATTPSPTQFTATAGPGGNIPSITAGPFTTGFVYQRSALGYAHDGTSMIFENGTVTNASFYVKSFAGEAIPIGGTIAGNHSTTISTTASVQAINAALNYSFRPTSNYNLVMMADRLQWADVGVDSTTQATNRALITQVVPDPNKSYKLRFRAVNNKSITVPNAQIVSVTKTGTTTATVVTDVPHGLTVADVIVTYGVRDQTNFANLLTATAVASVVDSTTFTVVWGSAVTATSYGGYVARVNGGNLMSALGGIAQVAQSVSISNSILTVVGNTTWAGISIGDYINLVGVRDNSTGASLNLDGAYRVREFATTNLILEPIGSTSIPSSLSSTNCGGAVIKRSDLRITAVRIFEYERLRVESISRPIGDIAASAPVSVQNTADVRLSGTNTLTTVTTVTNLSNGQAAHDAAVAGSPHRVSGRAVTANYTPVASGDTADLITTTVGALVVKPYSIPEVEWNASLSLTTTTAAAIQTAAGAGLKRHVTALQAINTGASPVDLIILDNVTERWRLTLPVDVPVTIQFPTSIVTTANAALNANLSAAGTVRANFQGYTAS